LQAASRVAPGGARVIAEISDASPLTALLREVNETVLGRTLMFESSAGSSMTLEVAGRRVLRLVAVNGLVNAEACLAAEALEDELKDDLIKLMQALTAPKHQLRVISAPMARGTEGLSVGLPVALLADLLLIELNEAAEAAAEPEPEPEPEVEREPADPPVLMGDGGFLSSFAQKAESVLMAWLILGGTEDGSAFGPEEMVSHLTGFLDEESDALNRQLDQIAEAPGLPVCMVLGAALTEGHSLICARADGGLLLGVIDGDGTSPVLRAWAAARA